MHKCGVIILLIALAFGVIFLLPDRAEAPESGILENMEMTLTSSAFEPNTTIPEMYSCDGDNTNPPLSISNVPEDAVSLVLLVDDPDIPEAIKKARLIEKFDHWAIFNIPVTTTEIEANTSELGTLGVNSAGDNAYRGPCPPPEHEPTEHRYIFQLYALDTELDLEAGATQEEIRSAMKGHIVTKTELIGLYDRANLSTSSGQVTN